MKAAKMVLALTMVILALIMTTGCATYNTHGAVPIMSRIPQNQLISSEKNGIEMIAFPIKTEEESKLYFDEDLLNDGILAIYLSVVNRTSESANINTVDLKIGKTTIMAEPSSLAYNAVKRAYGLRAFLWIFPTLYVGGPLSILHTYNVNT